MSQDHDHAGHDDHAGHEHAHHGHENDQGLRGALRYLRWAPSMWRSEINTAVLGRVDVQRGERVVDIGAGVGAGATVAARSGAFVVAVEPTPFLRRVLRVRRLFQRARKRIEVIDGTAEQLPVDESSVDAIWAVNTMHHWHDKRRGAAEIARVLRPGGRVVLVDEDFQNPSHPEFDRFGSEHGNDHHGFTLVDAASMGDLMTQVGLVHVEADEQLLAERPVIAVSARAPEA